MIYNYEVISSSKLDRSKSYIDFKKRQLFIKGIRLPTRKYYMYLRKLDVISNLNIVYIAFVKDKVNSACRLITRSDFGYYRVDFLEVFNEFNIKTDVNVEFKLEESDDMIEVYEIII